MALAPANDKKRVKVYELKNNDWYDRGTGFCLGNICSAPNGPPEALDARIIVTSEEEPTRTLLETRIAKDDGYQKQQETLIVWTESSGVDMALSFQEADGCAMIWEFVSDVQSRLVPEDGISDDLLDPVHSVTLPDPTLGKLDEVVEAIRNTSQTTAGRDAVAKFVMSPEQMYILKLAPLVDEAERLESAYDLHRLCTIMKLLILLNDTSIIEFVVTDQAIMGVVGALEYDPDFPSHRANHRQYLSDTSKFKEVVAFEHLDIKRKIHYTYRLLYLKDVVLARILDDPTFSVLNSLIFFHQVDIVNHIQSNQGFLKELFAIFTDDSDELERKKNAVLFIQNCCAVSKNIQPPSRAALYQNFINHGLFTVITFALRHRDAAVRVAGTDILVALIDHDAHLVRAHIARAINEKVVPLTDTLIELLLVEVDLGVKSQMADAIKILLDPASANRGGMVADQGHHGSRIPTQTNLFIQNFYDDGAKRLFKPLKDLEGRESMAGLTVQETSLYTHLVEVLCFFVRQHPYQSKMFILAENLHARVAQLLACPQKYMKLIALKWFRTCIGLQDEFHNGQIAKNHLFNPILNIVYETMPRDNLLNSACLELFEYIKRESIKGLIYHLAENYRERLMGITYVSTFHALIQRYDQLQHPHTGINGELGDTSFTTEPDTPDALRSRMMNGRQLFSGLREPDAAEDDYFNADDDLGDDEEGTLPTTATARLPNGHASPIKPLVDYPDDDDEDLPMEDILASSPDPVTREKKPNHSTDPSDFQRGRNRTPVAKDGSPGSQQSPPESIATKRRREEEDDDELGKMMGGGNKRRNSSASLRSVASENKVPTLASSPIVEGSPMSVSNPDKDDDDEAPLSPKSQPVSSPAVDKGQYTPTHALRRKGSLKVKNESGANNGRYAIKPINLSGVRTPTDSPQAKDSQKNGNGIKSEDVDGVDGDGDNDSGSGGGG
ncbi:unnamed protein product [Zymoseptoria tritici ST99CH_1E4]|uniref:Uncharacterized protein n=1 Tax=Zymoseptoria tritici ST99CH_1E4 TaxID=1276532 RepID=A0A2H1G6C1_ZYMTR|nr:unnamed protein product [Zymoseptoria tritici ST99CH_1E4]